MEQGEGDGAGEAGGSRTAPARRGGGAGRTLASLAILALPGSAFFMMREMLAIGRNRSCSHAAAAAPGGPGGSGAPPPPILLVPWPRALPCWHAASRFCVARFSLCKNLGFTRFHRANFGLATSSWARRPLGGGGGEAGFAVPGVPEETVEPWDLPLAAPIFLAQRSPAPLERGLRSRATWNGGVGSGPLEGTGPF